MKNLEFKKDKEWCIIDGEPCKVLNFTPTASVKNGKVSTVNMATPYASITIECEKFPEKVTGFINHKIDFLNLWTVFKERTVKQNEEVIIFWSKKHYKIKILKIFSVFLPKLWVMICQKEAYKIMTDPNYRSDLRGEARFIAKKPIIEWKPEIME